MLPCYPAALPTAPSGCRPRCLNGSQRTRYTVDITATEGILVALPRRRNLHADLAPWLQQQQQQPGGGPITVGAFARFVYDMATRGSAMARGTHLALVLVLRGRLHVVPLSERPSTLMTKRVSTEQLHLHMR